ncbi:MAG TPA: HIT family protein [Rhizomicrobium sp.]|nr:HIT family protein [Rhizomicrobium sp.]
MTTWDKLALGTDCPFDAPRPTSNEHWDLIAPLSVSSLYLQKNQTYRGHCILVLERHAIRPDQLSAEEWAAFCADLHVAERAVVQIVQPDHINIASLGNVMPHLHWHIVPRYRDDPRWGDPIWPTNLADMPDIRLSADEQAGLLAKLRAILG